jgi:hypothetical protein
MVVLGGRKVSKLQIKFEERMQESEAVFRCAYCRWKWKGVVAQGRVAAAEHRAKKHPEIQPKRRKRRGQWPKERG